MKVLLVGPSGHGGEEVYVRSLQQAPAPGVTYATVGSFHEGGDGARCRVVEEVLLNRLVHPCLVPDMGFRSLVATDKFDLVHVHAHPVRLEVGPTPVVMSEGSSVAVYLGEYLGWSEDRLRAGFDRSRRFYRLLGIRDRLLNLERVAKCYVFSDWARGINIRWGADPGKIEVIPPGFDTPAAPASPGVRPTFTFLFIGTDFERKGGFDVVEAFAHLVGDLPQACLRIVASDPSLPNPDRRIHSWVSPVRRQRLLDVMRRLEAAGKIVREKLVDRPRLMQEIFPSTDAFVMPTLAEGYGFTNVEAMSFGLPVVSSRVGPIAEVVDHGTTGLLAPPGDVDALAAMMSSLVEDRALTARLGRAGRVAFLERWTKERFRAVVGAFYAAAVEAS